MARAGGDPPLFSGRLAVPQDLGRKNPRPDNLPLFILHQWFFFLFFVRGPVGALDFLLSGEPSLVSLSVAPGVLRRRPSRLSTPRVFSRERPFPSSPRQEFLPLAQRARYSLVIHWPRPEKARASFEGCLMRIHTPFLPAAPPFLTLVDEGRATVEENRSHHSSCEGLSWQTG